MASRLGLLAFATLGWLAFAYMTVFTLTVGYQLTTGGVRQVDWHVYVAGARALIDHRLYSVPFDLGGMVLSTPRYNLPPLSTVWPIPLAVAARAMWSAPSGSLWRRLDSVQRNRGRIDAWGCGGRCCGRACSWASFSFTLLYLEGLHLATDNYLMLALVALGSPGWPVRREGPVGRVAWPRHRDQRLAARPCCSAASGTTVDHPGMGRAIVAAQGLAFLIWIGPDLPGKVLDAMRVAIPPTGFLIGPSAVDWMRPAWNSGLRSSLLRSSSWPFPFGVAPGLAWRSWPGWRPSRTSGSITRRPSSSRCVLYPRATCSAS